jgi:hypothetical protein
MRRSAPRALFSWPWHAFRAFVHACGWRALRLNGKCERLEKQRVECVATRFWPAISRSGADRITADSWSDAVADVTADRLLRSQRIRFGEGFSGERRERAPDESRPENSDRIPRWGERGPSLSRGGLGSGGTDASLQMRRTWPRGRPAGALAACRWLGKPLPRQRFFRREPVEAMWHAPCEVQTAGGLSGLMTPERRSERRP